MKNVKAVILAGGRDFGRCALASQWPAPLWPVEGRPALLRLLSYLAQEGLHHAVICGGQNTAMYRDAVVVKMGIDISFLREPLPVGTAGCIRDAAGDDPTELLLIFEGTIVSPPPVEWLIKAHRERPSDLTVFLNPPHNGCGKPELAGIYACSAETLKYIPQEGFCDIKEGLIPTLWRNGKSVQTATLPRPSGTFRNADEYLTAVFEHLRGRTDAAAAPPCFIHEQARISPNAHICGPVVVMEKAIICDDAVIIGPAIIEKGVIVESGAIVRHSALWAGARIGHNAHVHQCVVSYDADVAAYAVFEEEVFTGTKSRIAEAFEIGTTSTYNGAKKTHYRFRAAADEIKRRVPVMARIARSFEWAGDWLRLIMLFAVFFWLYQPEIIQLWNIWLRNDEYSSGLIIPLLAAYIVWSKRKEFKRLPKRSLAAGLVVFLAAQALRLFGLAFMYDSAQRLSLVLSAAAIVLYLFGWPLFRRMTPLLLFLLLMLPIPNSVNAKITVPLQNWATSSAIFSLEMMGLEVTREGNIIHLGDATVAVAEACNGLRMVTAFFVISGLVALLVERAWWEKVVLFLSALPIGLLCNTLRLTLTAVAFTAVKGPFWEKMFHDFGGLAMMPVAIGAVILELWFLKRLTVPLDTMETA
ncbi:MAG: exosortase [Sedimentisphaerales bacterium]|nr:exosortase [Sedimentisphaerales bacterium]